MVNLDRLQADLKDLRDECIRRGVPHTHRRDIEAVLNATIPAVEYARERNLAA